jgi:hypothetical protein
MTNTKAKYFVYEAGQYSYDERELHTFETLELAKDFYDRVKADLKSYGVLVEFESVEVPDDVEDLNTDFARARLSARETNRPSDTPKR